MTNHSLDKAGWCAAAGLALIILGCGGEESPIRFDCGNPVVGTTMLRGESGVLSQQNLVNAQGPLRICEIESEVSLPNLESAQLIEVIGSNKGLVRFPRLEEADQILVQGEVRINLPALELVGRLQVVENTESWDLHLPMLRQAQYLGAVQPNARLLAPQLEEVAILINYGDLEAPRLRKATNHIRTQVNIGTTSRPLPALESTQQGLNLTFVGTTTSATVSLPSFTTTHSLWLEGSAPQALSLPALETADNLSIVDMAELEGIDMPKLTSLQELIVRNTPMLSMCAIDALMLQTNLSTATIENVGPPCP